MDGLASQVMKAFWLFMSRERGGDSNQLFVLYRDCSISDGRLDACIASISTMSPE